MALPCGDSIPQYMCNADIYNMEGTKCMDKVAIFYWSYFLFS